MVMQQCTECVAEAAAEHGLDDVALLVGGDFNCGTSEGVFEFLSSGRRRKIPSFWQHLFFLQHLGARRRRTPRTRGR